MHSPATKKGTAESAPQLRQSVAVGPLHVAQEAEHGAHELFASAYLPSCTARRDGVSATPSLSRRRPSQTQTLS